MKKGIEGIRKSINKRKAVKEQHLTKEKWQEDVNKMDLLPRDEERYGEYYMYPDMSGTKIQEHTHTSASGFILKGFFSIALFLGTAFISQTESEQYSSMKQWTSAVYQNEFPFAKVNEWYQEAFGDPFFIAHEASVSIAENNKMYALPVNGRVEQPFHKNGRGVLIAPENTENVVSVQKGIVIFAGNDSETNKTVTIQHPDGSNTTYGFLSSLDVHLYQSVQKNQLIGRFLPNKKSEYVYFSLEKDNQFLDPLKVIQVDDQS